MILFITILLHVEVLNFKTFQGLIYLFSNSSYHFERLVLMFKISRI